MQYIYHSVRIVDFKARPERVVYILAAGDKGFAIINNDSDMTERSEIHSRETRRHTTVGRLLNENWKKAINGGSSISGPGTPFKGLAYPRFYRNDGGAKIAKEVRDKGISEKYPDLYAVEGGIFENGLNSYTTINELETNDNPSDIAKLFTQPLLTQLEHFLVPDDMASKIREYVKIHQSS